MVIQMDILAPITTAPNRLLANFRFIQVKWRYFNKRCTFAASCECSRLAAASFATACADSACFSSKSVFQKLPLKFLLQSAKIHSPPHHSRTCNLPLFMLLLLLMMMMMTLLFMLMEMATGDPHTSPKPSQKTAPLHHSTKSCPAPAGTFPQRWKHPMEDGWENSYTSQNHLLESMIGI